jgi:hypothetical protein
MRSIHNQMLGIFRMVITTNILQHFTTEVRIFVFALLIYVNRVSWLILPSDIQERILKQVE